MIQIDFAWTITFLISLIPLLVLWLWIFYTTDCSQTENESSDLEQCPFCTYLFFKFTIKTFVICPRCKSLINADENVKTNPEIT